MSGNRFNIIYNIPEEIPVLDKSNPQVGQQFYDSQDFYEGICEIVEIKVNGTYNITTYTLKWLTGHSIERHKKTPGFLDSANDSYFKCNNVKRIR